MAPAARPTGFYRDALRSDAGMQSRLAWQQLPDSLSRVATDVDGLCTDHGVFMFLADLLTLWAGPATEAERWVVCSNGLPTVLHAHEAPQRTSSGTQVRGRLGNNLVQAA